MSTTKVSARPDLAAHDHATRASLSFVVKELIDLLGARLVAYIAGVTETRAVHGWAREGRAPKDPQVPDRLRLALRVTKLISDHDNPHVAQAWLQGLNPATQ